MVLHDLSHCPLIPREIQILPFIRREPLSLILLKIQYPLFYDIGVVVIQLLRDALYLGFPLLWLLPPRYLQDIDVQVVLVPEFLL